MSVIDLRSDTVTRPTEAMWEAMRRAPLGDDVLGDEPTVARLETEVARRLGKAAALFVPSGTMANQLAIRCHCEPGDEIVAHRESHIIHYETGAPAALSGCMIRPLDGPGGLFDAQAVRAARRHRDIHSPRPRLLVVENTHNRGGGTLWPLQDLHHVAQAAREDGLAVHMDGARLWNACVASGHAPADFAAHADTVSVCFSKGLGCPVGSALAGPAPLIERARRFRKMLGGGMRQSGLLAAAALHALSHHMERLAQDHAHARRLAALASSIPGITLPCPADAIPTNMVFLHVDARRLGAPELQARLEQSGVLTLALDPARLRLVTHLDIQTPDVERAAAALTRAMST
ncbi:MAG: aminotransferase class I/II-fold pyridoxal phosphate-dependent enzyme [Planctomycetes bacterium]|nr:aminotransferase class I/II-fold pyridoxal phosphate-dependent enzyme [Planctomycetota bacterium]